MRIGIDLGGHTLSAALVDAENSIIRKIESATPPSRSVLDVLDMIAVMVSQLEEGTQCSGVGIGIPGMVDLERKGVYKLPNFPGWERVPLKSLLEENILLPVVIENDANCYALGEGSAGQARGIKDYVVFTLGTGIGGGVVCGGKLIMGAHGIAGELGHIAVAEQRPCGCGALGHVETVSAADGIESEARRMGFPADVVTLWQKRGEKGISPIWENVFDTLARAIASVTHILDPDMIIIGGGMSRAKGLLRELEPYVIKYTAPVFLPWMDIRKSDLGNDAALIGAASLIES